MTAIGLLNEKSLHSALKHWYARPGDLLEVPLDGYIVDILRGDHVIEIQTGNFSSIKRKMRDLSCRYRVTLIYPVAHERWILEVPGTLQGAIMRGATGAFKGHWPISDIYWHITRSPVF